MSDRLIREFRAQLTMTMDSALRRIVFEIMNTFENSLLDHQIELTQKGEESVQLKTKLQKAEVSVKEHEPASEREEENKTTQRGRESEAVPSAPEHKSEVPEIDFEVPDDWCAPLGCETMTKEEDGVCPSVRLRQVYIPLWQVPLSEKKQPCIFKEHEATQDSLSVDNQGIRQPPVRNDVTQLLQDTRQDPIAHAVRAKHFKRRKGRSTRKKQKNIVRSKGEKNGTTENISNSIVQETVGNCVEKKYSCKYCNKEFDTRFGRRVHLRTHRKCRGCKKMFPFPSSLKAHSARCKKLIFLANKAQSTDLPKAQSSDEEKSNTPSNEQDNTPSLSRQCESAKRERSIKKYPCLLCNILFPTRLKMVEHMHIHTDEKPCSWNMFPKTSRRKKVLKLHRVHKGQVDPGENRGLSWTKPLDVIKDNQQDSAPASNPVQQSPKTNPSSTSQQKCPETKDRSWDSKWQTMGTCTVEGYTCSVCQRLTKTKYQLVEHYRLHTGEKPFKCDHCPLRFRCNRQLMNHRKKCVTAKFQCDECGQRFSVKVKYESHVNRLHKNWALFCEVCGKGFIHKGNLQNHMEYHKFSNM